MSDQPIDQQPTSEQVEAKPTVDQPSVAQPVLEVKQIIEKDPFCVKCEFRHSHNCRKCDQQTNMCYVCMNAHHKCQDKVSHIISGGIDSQSLIQALVEQQNKHATDLKQQHEQQLEDVKQSYEAMIIKLELQLSETKRIYTERIDRMRETYDQALTDMNSTIEELREQKNALNEQSTMNTLKRQEMAAQLESMKKEFEEIGSELKETKKSLKPTPSVSSRGRGVLVRRGISSMNPTTLDKPRDNNVIASTEH